MSITKGNLRGLKEGRSLSWRIRVKEQGLIQAECVDGGTVVERAEGWGQNTASGSNPFSCLSLSYFTAVAGCDLKTVSFF